MAKVTVAIPTYNRQEYLRECLQSVLQQSFQDFEVIIFDNHSDYDILGLVDSFADPRIKVLSNEVNIGAIQNMNLAFTYQYATPYAVVFHDDDAMHPDLLAKEVALLDSDKDMVFVVTDLNGVRSNDQMLDFAKIEDGDSVCVFPNYADLVRLLLKHVDFCFDSIMYRVSALNGIIEYGKRFIKWADRPFFIDIAKKGTVAVIREKLVNYRVHVGQSSQEEHGKAFSYFSDLYNYYKESLPQPLTESDKKLFYRWSTNNLILAITWFSSDMKAYFKLLKRCREINLFKFKYINMRGVYYFFLAIKKWLRRL